MNAFQEDKDALEWISALVRRETRRQFAEASFAGDRARTRHAKVDHGPSGCRSQEAGPYFLN